MSGRERGIFRYFGEMLLRAINSVLTYDASGNLTQVVETDVTTGKARTSTLAYDASGNLISVTQVTS